MRGILLDFLERTARILTGVDDPFFKAVPLGYKEGIRACLADRDYRKALLKKKGEPTVLFILYNPSCYRIFGRLLKDSRLGQLGLKIRILSLNPQHGDNFYYPSAYSLAELLKGLDGSSVKWLVQSSDFEAFRDGPHRKGCALGDFFEGLGARRMVVQHGGSRSDSMRALSTSGAGIFCVWGKLAATSLQELGIESERIHIVGNISREPEVPAQKDLQDTGSILIATCMHTEYPNEPKGQGLYQEWLRESIRLFLPYGKVRLRRHPMDEIHAIGSCEFVVNFHFPDENVEIISEQEGLVESLDSTDLVVSRASTVLEEALLHGLGAVAVDFTSDPYLESQQVLTAIPRFKCFTFDELDQQPVSRESVKKLIADKKKGDVSTIARAFEYLDARTKEDPLSKMLSLFTELVR